MNDRWLRGAVPLLALGLALGGCGGDAEEALPGAVGSGAEGAAVLQAESGELEGVTVDTQAIPGSDTVGVAP